MYERPRGHRPLRRGKHAQVTEGSGSGSLDHHALACQKFRLLALACFLRRCQLDVEDQGVEGGTRNLRVGRSPRKIGLIVGKSAAVDLQASQISQACYC
jgi:hypothetical protein